MIGVLGGTFDPIHYGHLRPAQEVLGALGLTEMRLIPAGHPPHRPPPLATADERREMVRLACKEFPGFVIDDRELKRVGPSYSVDTLESLRTELGPQTGLCLLMGTDAFRAFETWHEWERIPELAHLVVMHRPGWEVPLILPEWARLRRVETGAELARLPAGRLWFQPVTPQEISGTWLRTAIASREPVQAWFPATVWEFIQMHHTYVTSES